MIKIRIANLSKGHSCHWAANTTISLEGFLSINTTFNWSRNGQQQKCVKEAWACPVKECSSGSPQVVNDRDRDAPAQRKPREAPVPSRMLVYPHDTVCVWPWGCHRELQSWLLLAIPAWPGFRCLREQCTWAGSVCFGQIQQSESKFCSRETILWLK